MNALRQPISTTRSTRNLLAFTLIELLVVIAIIVLLVSILVPSLKQAKELARKAICMTNMKNIGQGYFMYGASNHVLPPTSYGSNPGHGIETYAQWSWILVKEGTLDGKLTRYFDGAEGDVFLCPSKGSKIQDKDRANANWTADYGPNLRLTPSVGGTLNGQRVTEDPKTWAQLSSLNGSAYLLLENKMYQNSRGTWLPGKTYVCPWDPMPNWDLTKPGGYQADAHNKTTNVLFADSHVENLDGDEPYEIYLVKGFYKLPWWNE